MQGLQGFGKRCQDAASASASNIPEVLAPQAPLPPLNPVSRPLSHPSRIPPHRTTATRRRQIGIQTMSICQYYELLFVCCLCALEWAQSPEPGSGHPLWRGPTTTTKRPTSVSTPLSSLLDFLGKDNRRLEAADVHSNADKQQSKSNNRCVCHSSVLTESMC